MDQRFVNAKNPQATLEDVYAAWAERAQATGVPSWTSPAPAQIGYVSLNRWVADCPECNSGAAAWPRNPEACCYGCGATFKVLFPPDWQAAAAVLEQRAQKHRHWQPLAETLDDLKAENVEHGDPI